MRRNWRASAAALALVVVAAAASHAEPEDPFALAIDAGRMQIFNDRIAQVLDKMPGRDEPGDLARAAASLRQATLNFLALEARACSEGKFAAEACRRTPAPGWLGEPADKAVAAAVLRARLDDLQERMAALLEAACAEGRKIEKDELYCSVE